MLFISFFFYRKAEEEGTKAKHAPARIEILNHNINYLNTNMSEEVNAKARNSLLVDHKFVCNDISPCTSRKHTNPLCGKVVS